MESTVKGILGLYGENEKKMETTGIIGVYKDYIRIIGYILGLYGDNGKEN